MTISSPRLAHPDHDVAAIGAELHRVVDEVDDDLPEPGRIAADGGQAVGRVDVESHALAVREQAQPLGRLAGEAPHVQAVDQVQRPAALDPRQVQQLVDHLDEVAGLDLDLADPVAHLGREVGIAGVGFAGQRLGQQADRGQRRPELVRQVVDELRSDPLQPAQLGDIVDR